MQRLLRRIPWLNPSSTSQIVPAELQPRFHHLYWDIAWFGLVAGTTLAFLNVYAARLGASAFQIGMLTAGPALINLIFTLPAGRWLQARPIGQSVFRAALATRGVYLIYALLPLLLPPGAQVQVLIWGTLLLTIPGVALVIGFNALFAASVPLEWRAYVAGRRNAMLSVVYIVTSLVAGYILQNTPLEVGYTLIFGIGLVGAVMSTYHVSRLRDVSELPGDEPQRIRQIIGDTAQPGGVRAGQGVGQRVSIAPRVFTRGRNLLRADVVQGHYGWVLFALFGFHLAQFMPVALFPLRWVDQLGFKDMDIAIGTAVFHASVLVGALQLDRLTRRHGNHRLAVIGVALLSTYPLFTAFMPNLFFYAVTSLIGGLAWGLVGGALPNYLLEKVPPNDRPAYLAWYNLALNAAIFLGALLGPLMANWFNLQIALVLAFVFRLASAIFMWFVERIKPAEAATAS
ncbi:MFS transporter [Caldilinea sp.]|uniref:MFS transporter n=1 Tax=Caldilinea sp. TaxID=2293560 RepID=UPI002CEDFDF9|nr:MFS transporter [Caldilinea sp.]